MKLEDFNAGTYIPQSGYKSFTPSTVNHLWTWEDPTVNTLLEQAGKALAELNAFSVIVPDVDLYIRMHIFKEANTSSRIEGTRTELAEDLSDKEYVSPEKRSDWQEVQNYIEAMNKAIEELEKLPLSTRLLQQTHSILMRAARGHHKSPGEYRRSQNWIGGSSIQDAVFIPPHFTEIGPLMGDLEKFWHNNNIEVPHLIRIAISHYQFETIHPFLDGNGRIGRLLITLYLVARDLLLKPSLYLSAYLEKNKGAYFDALTTVRASNDMLHWVKFFLVAVKETALKGKETFQKILALREEIDTKLDSLGIRSANARKLLSHLYENPIITANRAAGYLDVSYPTASKLIRDLERLGILRRIATTRKERLFMFSRYYSLFID
ncbi:MAG: Fic family protein [Planctomycetota bacterium]